MATSGPVLNYSPRLAFLPYHERKERFAIGVAHRRCGKTVACINDMIMAAGWRGFKKPRYRAAYVAPYARQAKDIAWQYLKEFSEPLWGKPPNESELYVELTNGARIRIYGADNSEALRGAYLDDVILDEYADMAPSVWGAIIRPMLADRQGTATFIGTPKGKNAFWEIYNRGLNDPDWFTFFLPASETGILPQSELKAAKADMTIEQYEQEFECSFDAAILGAYFGREMAQADRDGRIVDELEKVDSDIHTVWDFGHGANMAVWAFQVGPEGPLVHDFIQISGAYFNDYLAEIRRRGYSGFAYVPHDAKVPNFETGRTRIETMLGEGHRPVLVSDHHVSDRINAAKLTIGRTRFNGRSCAAGLEALRQYRQDWDDKARVFKNTPKHDWASHPADAFGYLAMAWREHIQPEIDMAEPVKLRGLNETTFDELTDFHEGGHEKRDRV